MKTTVYLIASLLYGVEETEIDPIYNGYEQCFSELGFYNRLLTLKDNEVIYCKFDVESDVYHRIQVEYGITSEKESCDFGCEYHCTENFTIEHKCREL